MNIFRLATVSQADGCSAPKMRTQFCALRRDGFLCGCQQKRSAEADLASFNGNFAFGEYTRVLRLTSELVDLRTEYANPILRFAQRWVLCAGANAKGLPKGRPCIGTRNGNRTHNYPLGGGYYIHLTMQAYEIVCFVIKREVQHIHYSIFCLKKQALFERNYILFEWLYLKLHICICANRPNFKKV